MRRWGVLLVAALAAIVGVSWGGSPAVADEADDFESAIAAWHPVDLPDGAVPAAPADFDSKALDGCESGKSLSWDVAGRPVATALWMRCATPAAAAQRLADAWSSSQLYPDPALSTALGADVELAARAVETNGDPFVYRLWSQGEHYLVVGRTCAAGDAACAARTAADAKSLAGLSDAPPNPLALPHVSESDPLAAFAPRDDSGWVLKFSLPADTTVKGGDARCGNGLATQWINNAGETMKVFRVDCKTVETARGLVTDYWRKVDAVGLSTLFGPGLDGVSRESGTGGVVQIFRWWLQGSEYLQVSRSCPKDDEARCAELTAADVRAIVPMLPGAMQSVTDWNKALGALMVLLGVPIATYLLILVPRRIIARRRQREVPPTAAELSTSAYVSVDAMVRKARRGRLARRWIVVVTGTLLSIALIVAMLPTNELWLQVLTLFVAPIVIFFALAGLVELVWRPHRLVRPPRPPSRPTLRAAAGVLLRGLAIFVAMATIILYVVAVLFTWVNGLRTDEGFRSDMQAQIAASAFPFNVVSAAQLQLWEMARTGWIVVLFFAAVAIPIFLAYLLDRVGRRLARQSLQDTLARDVRPHFLYLRGFDEDGLRIDESLGRRGFLELFSPFGRPRFEEVLAEHLSSWGPVIAISGSKQRLPDLGAAKVTLGGDQWQDQVREWVDGARAIVLSATPSEVRAGLEWEIEHLAAREDAPPVILVVAPWPRAERVRRWEGFLASAGRFAMFHPLIEQPPPSATNLLTYSADRGWIAYGARRRWDWSYAASLLTAVEAGDLDRAAMAGTVPALARDGEQT